MADVHELLDTWIANVKDEELLAELNTMKEQGDEDAITDAFFQDLAFGTAGLRGTIGAGTNRMNIYTVGPIRSVVRPRDSLTTSMRPSSIRRSPSLAIAAIKVSCSSRRRLPFLQQTA